jgi:predicted dehydrogenase
LGSGGIGSLQRSALKGYAPIEWAGFCDVDTRELEKVQQTAPSAWTTQDYREAFAKHVGDFDAVIVDVPDFHHTPMILTALKNNKHVYAQKPLVHQLEELRMVRDALNAKPKLVTLDGQSACMHHRSHAVGGNPSPQPARKTARSVGLDGLASSAATISPTPGVPILAAKPVPEYLNWDLWRGPLKSELPYSEDLAPRRWRAFWETGGGQLADWGCHLLDLLYFAYDLPSPEAVLTQHAASVEYRPLGA